MAHRLRSPAFPVARAQRIGELEREVRELRPANEILRTALRSLAAADLDRKLRTTAVLADYIDQQPRCVARCAQSVG